MKILDRFLLPAPMRNFRRQSRDDAHIRQDVLFRYKVGFIRNGKRHFVGGWRNNLILDSGLNKVASTLWQSCWSTCIFGNQVAPTPVARNGGALTFSQTLTTITASGGFFVAQDTGRLFKFDSGEECYITYVNATTVTASISRTVGSGPGTVWYVNQTAVESVFSYSTGYGVTGGDNGTSSVGPVITFKRTFLGAAVGSATTLTEIGFNSGASNVNIFDRDIIVGGVSLLIGDIPLAVAEMIMSVAGTTPQAVGNVTTGFDSSGNSQIIALGFDSAGGGSNLSWVDSSGNTVGCGGLGALEPSEGGISGVQTANYTIPAFTTGAVTNMGVSVPANGGSAAAYTNGNFYRDFTSTWGITIANGTIYGYTTRDLNTRPGFSQKFTTPFAKTSAQTLSMTLRRSWQRILVN